MAQETKIIDIRRSFIPISPNAYPSTYHATEDEDKPEPRIPVVAYDGYNFMPTPQGYASFFGVNSTLGILPITEPVADAFPKPLRTFGQFLFRSDPKRQKPTRTRFLDKFIRKIIIAGGTGKVDDIFMIQTNTLQNILVALCDDGIWTKSTNSAGNWTRVITLTPPVLTSSHLQWSKCVLENTIYAYRQSEQNVYQAGPANGFIFTGFVPTFLNMAGQLGIFKAGGRLGFWDSENSIAWATLGNPTNATPDTKTLSGATIFQDIVGRIVNVLQHGTGFIVYCTKSIVNVTRDLASPLIWKGQAIFNSNGISYREEVCFGEPDTKHYAFTTQGIVEIVNGQPEFVVPEVATYLKEKRKPVYIKIMNGRYLFFPILDPYYLEGLTHFMTEDFGIITLTFNGASYSAAHPDESMCKSYNAVDRQSREIAIFNTFEFTQCGQATANGTVRKYRDNLSTSIGVATISDYKNNGIDPNFNTNGQIVGIDGVTRYFLPNVLLQTTAFNDIIHQEDNTNNFYKKQEMLWAWEDKFAKDWVKAILNRKVKDASNIVLQAVGFDPFTAVRRDITNFGPFVLPTFESESNRYYGKAIKSQWLQRSLTQTVQVRVFSETRYDLSTVRGCIYDNEISVPNFNTLMNPTALIAIAVAFYAGSLGAITGVTYANGALVGAVRITFATGTGPYPLQMDPLDPLVEIGNVPTNLLNQGYTFGIYPVWIIDGKRTQSFYTELQFSSVPKCIHRQLGFTDIVGHGKFDVNCNFTQTDSTPEPPDYVDRCESNPVEPKRKQPIFLTQFTNWDDLLCNKQDATINSVTYSYPEIPVTIPGGSILLQEGSIEPIYPTYLGAFVYDTQYKKWGKMKQNYKQLLDYFPINNVAGDTPIPYDTFLPKGAILLESGLIGLFDQFPSDSRIVFGKVGMYRKGFTDVQEVRIQNRTPLSGTVTVEGSLDGKNVEAAITQTQTFADATQVTANFGLSARWYNIIVEGNYDITAMEMRSTKKGKR